MADILIDTKVQKTGLLYKLPFANQLVRPRGSWKKRFFIVKVTGARTYLIPFQLGAAQHTPVHRRPLSLFASLPHSLPHLPHLHHRVAPTSCLHGLACCVLGWDTSNTEEI